jgi:ribosome-associated translation inhibitor RaiA
MTQLVPDNSPHNPPPPPNGSSNTAVRWVVGCLVALLVLALVIGGLVWWFVIRPVQGVIGNLTNLSQLEELDKQIRNTSAYTPPASGEISGEQLERLLSVQRSIKTQVGERLKQLEGKYNEVNEQDFSKALEGLGDLFKVLVEAKKAQVDALNAQNFSKNEYRWVRDGTFQALSQVTGQPFSGFPDLQGATPQIYAPSTPSSANVERVTPFKDELTESLPMHLFGL